MNVVYVILHYMAGNDTIECINSILQSTANSEHNTSVVVVDNNSVNNSFNEIVDAFKDNNKVIILKNKENLGFARGNNVGVAYAKNNLKADFVVQLNNDTIIKQLDFNEILVKKYDEKKYSVLGPDIITADGYHQNPGNKQRWSYRELYAFRIKKHIILLLSYLRFDKSFSGLTKSKNEVYCQEAIDHDVENTILHGACLIFSPLFLERFNGMYDKTFLYWEEDILKLQSDLYGFLMMYTCDLSIYHKEDAATNMVEGSVDSKKRRKYRMLIKSCRIYTKLKRYLKMKNSFIRFIEKIAGSSKNDGSYSIDLDMPISYLLGVLLNRFGMLMRGKLYSVGLKKEGTGSIFGKKVTLKCKSKIVMGTGVSIANNVYIDALSKKGIVIGNGCSIGSNTIIRCSGNYKKLGVGFSIGDNSSLADNCFVGATGGVTIGNDVIGGQNIRFHSSNHVYDNVEELIRKQGVTSKGIKVGDNCWIGAGVVFCDGVEIGDGCVIGANSVVTKSFPDNCVIAGVPARKIKDR